LHEKVWSNKKLHGCETPKKKKGIGRVLKNYPNESKTCPMAGMNRVPGGQSGKQKKGSKGIGLARRKRRRPFRGRCVVKGRFKRTGPKTGCEKRGVGKRRDEKTVDGKPGRKNSITRTGAQNKKRSQPSLGRKLWATCGGRKVRRERGKAKKGTKKGGQDRACQQYARNQRSINKKKAGPSIGRGKKG